MRTQSRRPRLYEEKEVYVVDKSSELYGSKLIVDFFLADGTPSFREPETKRPVELRMDQISEHPPLGNIQDTFK
jgi:hypothetical protein